MDWFILWCTHIILLRCIVIRSGGSRHWPLAKWHSSCWWMHRQFIFFIPDANYTQSNYSMHILHMLLVCWYCLLTFTFIRTFSPVAKKWNETRPKNEKRVNRNSEFITIERKEEKNLAGKIKFTKKCYAWYLHYEQDCQAKDRCSCCTISL